MEWPTCGYTPSVQRIRWTTTRTSWLQRFYIAMAAAIALFTAVVLATDRTWTAAAAFFVIAIVCVAVFVRGHDYAKEHPEDQV